MTGPEPIGPWSAVARFPSSAASLGQRIAVRMAEPSYPPEKTLA